MPYFRWFMETISGRGRQQIGNLPVQAFVDPLENPAFKGPPLAGLEQFIHDLTRADLADNELEHRWMVFSLGVGENRQPFLKIAIDIAAGENFGLRRPQVKGVQPLELETGKTGFFKFAKFGVMNHREIHKAIIP